MKDNLYQNSTEPVKPFEFDQKVVDVFPDMIKRSVPGYPLTISMISVIADQYIQPGSNVYDLGCSLGAVSLAIQQSAHVKDCRTIAVDNSQAMIDSCVKNIPNHNDGQNIEFRCEDIQQTSIDNASLVIMNFTLQFIPLEQRETLIKKIYDALLPGGVFVLSEKIKFDSEFENNMMQQLHHHMKALNGYDELEIAGKRQALEEVLIPETMRIHQARIEQAGFKEVLTWLRCFNFASMIAFK